MVRYLRYLRIAFSATCLIACVLLIALWVRSYWWQDILHFTVAGRADITIGSHWGGFWITAVDLRNLMSGLQELFPNQPVTFSSSFTGTDSHARPLWGYSTKTTPFPITTIVSCHCFSILLLVTFAAVPWIRHLKWRFSLRTLFIATTLVAVVLGAIAYAAR